MPQLLHREHIYDAVLDDELFGKLPSILNQAYDARSCTLHWRHEEGSAEVMAHSGHFTNDHMLDYANNFTQTDLWSLEALRPSRANQVWNCDDLVSAKEYENSAFYNDWIRGMGDDTFHCIGVAIRTQWGFGFIGLHRGRSQGSFEPRSVAALKADVADLGRMLALRGQLASAARREGNLTTMVDAIANPILLVTAMGRIVEANAAAEEILRKGDGLRRHKGVLAATSCAANKQLEGAIFAASASQAGGAISIPKADGGQHVLSLVAVACEGSPRKVLITALAERPDKTREARLRHLFGLSPSEAQIAVRLSQGVTLAELAEERAVSLGTIRSQVKAVSGKLGCSRQSNIVRIVLSLPPL